MTGQLFVISAPSGAGKSTIIHALRERMVGIGYSISHTSRTPRAGEKDSVDYHFVDRETFARMIEAGAFLEWARVYDDFYGTSHSSVDELISQGIDVLLDLDPQGARSIRERYEKSVHVYILPPSLQILEKRLRRRNTDGESVIRMRMEKAAKEITAYQWYDYVIVNEDLEQAVRQVESIIIAERCRTARRVSDLQMRYHVSGT